MKHRIDLFVDQAGSDLHVQKGMFAVVTEAETRRFSVRRLRSIALTRACTLSTDAIALAMQHRIPVLFVTPQGRTRGRLWSQVYGRSLGARRAQTQWAQSPRALSWTLEQVQGKLEAQIRLLRYLLGVYPGKTQQARRAQADLENRWETWADRCVAIEAASDPFQALRGEEGQMGNAYFSGLANFLPADLGFPGRLPYPARDLVNAALNYGYSLLYREVEGGLIKAGLDPYQPLFHRTQIHRPALVYDVVEPFRPWVDHLIVQLCRGHKLQPDQFTPGEEADKPGLLNPQARRALIEAGQGFWLQRTRLAGHRKTRRAYIEGAAQALKQRLLSESRFEAHP